MKFKIEEWKLSLLFLALALLAYLSIHAGNAFHLAFYPYLFGTSIGKTVLFLLFLAVVFLPIRLKLNWLPAVGAAIAMILFLGATGWFLGSQLNGQIIENAGLGELAKNESIAATASVYEKDLPLKYDGTSITHNHALKAMFCFLPKGEMDYCGPTEKLFPEKSVFLPLLLLLAAALLVILAIAYSTEDKRRKAVFSISLFAFLLAAIDGGVLSPQFALFLGTAAAIVLAEYNEAKGVWKFAYCLIPLALFTIRNVALQGQYLPVENSLKIAFLLIPAAFILPRNFKELAIGVVFAGLAFSAVQIMEMEPLTPESSFTFHGNASRFSFENEVVATDGMATTFRFYTKDVFRVYAEMSEQDRGYAFKSFLYKMERCNAIKENVAIVETSRPEKLAQTDSIRVVRVEPFGKYWKVRYLCACTDCAAIAMFQERKATGEQTMTQVNFLILRKKGFGEILADSIPFLESKQETIYII